MPPRRRRSRLSETLVAARSSSDFIIIDTPGSDTELSRLGHAAADTLVTPMNDSFLDFDLLARSTPTVSKSTARACTRNLSGTAANAA